MNIIKATVLTQVVVADPCCFNWIGCFTQKDNLMEVWIGLLARKGILSYFMCWNLTVT
jgi:hypothetical protein